MENIIAIGIMYDVIYSQLNSVTEKSSHLGLVKTAGFCSQISHKTGDCNLSKEILTYMRHFRINKVHKMFTFSN